ncbi:single-stranded DNA-binding protein [Terracoccus luteus]|uniref:Single-strand DNA-binding protein n=1 Tax=Terracoccus luteus TaxID=53356 RepID=A0A839PTR7_9MICO|nr:single-stranded DNA-binding protein [Terracoccus luteus]MBB2987658.1 single-strand DNA-binding protein [Terracoccus luteus]MCP2173309.1 single-strand DNA-binding protein [Terracoccus luteus]
MATRTVKPERGAEVGRTARAREQAGGDVPRPSRNEIVLHGRLSAAAEQRELPSGDVIVTLRVVVARPARARAPGVDTIDVVCWSAVSRRTALRLPAGQDVEVTGSLRRRFYGGPTGRQSRYEVEAVSVRRLVGGASVGT